MAHLNDKLADFFYEELPATEMVEARRHVADCGECRAQVQLFERTHLALKNLPDAELPRRVIFARPERTTAWASPRLALSCTHGHGSCGAGHRYHAGLFSCPSPCACRRYGTRTRACRRADREPRSITTALSTRFDNPSAHGLRINWRNATGKSGSLKVSWLITRVISAR